MSSIHEQEKIVESEIKKLEEMGGSLAHQAKSFRDTAFAKFPVVFVLLSTFGLVATLYGFEKVIDGIDLFANHPLLVLIFGIAVLAVTGTLYKKLN